MDLSDKINSFIYIEGPPVPSQKKLDCSQVRFPRTPYISRPEGTFEMLPDQKCLLWYAQNSFASANRRMDGTADPVTVTSTIDLNGQPWTASVRYGAGEAVYINRDKREFPIVFG